MSSIKKQNLRLIGIIGKAGSGKDTTGEHIKKNYNGVGYAFADPIKEICRIMFLFDDEQLYGSKKEVLDERWGITPREVFQKFGTNMMQFAVYGFMPGLIDKVPVRQFWIHHFRLWYNDFISKPENDNKIVVVTDVRFHHEAELIRELNGTLIKIERPDLRTDSVVYQHSSETSIGDIEADVTIVNDKTIEELYQHVDTIITNLL